MFTTVRLGFLIGAICAYGCTPSYPYLEFIEADDAFHVSGVIDARAIDQFEMARAQAPQVKKLVFDFVPGSADDVSNLTLARQIRQLGFETILPDDGLIASGGTDLFLAGGKRTVHPGACVGVHTWGDESVGIGSEVPRNDPIHQLYLSYYEEIGISAEFYWFTLDAAGPEEAHWISSDEMQRFQIATDPETNLKTMTEDEDQNCDLRLEQLAQKLGF